MSNFVPQTEIVLCNHVPFDRSYETSVLFDNEQEQQAFFRNRQVLTIPRNTYQRVSMSSFRVEAKADDLREQGVNYCYWKNGNYTNKYYYAFVNSIEYVNPNTAIIYYELDNIQTYMFDLKWQQSYIERKHYDLGNRDNEGNLTSFTCPLEEENLNYGNIYKVIKRENLVQIPDVSFVVFGCTLNGYGNYKWSDMPLSLSYIIVPCYVGLRSSGGTNSGTITFTLNGTSLMGCETLLNLFRNSSSLVGSLVSITLIPFLPTSDLSYSWSSSTNIALTSSTLTSINLGTTFNQGNVLKFTFNEIGKYVFKESGKTLSQFPKYSEQKLYMNPYSFNVLSTDRGNDLIIKNEYISDESINVTMHGTINTANKQMFIVNNYNDSNSDNIMDNGIIDESNSSLPIVDDYTASYVQSNKNAIEVARSNALATMKTNINNSNNTYRTSMQQIALSKQQAQNSYDTANLTSAVQFGSSMVQSGVMLVSGIASTNAGGNVASAINQGIQSGTDYYNNLQNAQTTLANNLLSNESNAIGSATAQANAIATANTDYQNTIATLNAKYEDAQAISDTAKSLGNDYIFNLASNHDGLYLYKKTIREEWILKLTNYFKMYGYLANEMGQVDTAIDSREQYNYIKLVQCNVTGDLPQDNLMAIKSIYMKGITFYHELKAVSGQESDYACAYTNLANSYDECMYNCESNVPRRSTHNIAFSYVDNNGTLSVNGSNNPSKIDNITNGKEYNIKLTANSGYHVVGLYGGRLGVLYEGNDITLKIYHDEVFTPIFEQDN